MSSKVWLDDKTSVEAEKNATMNNMVSEYANYESDPMERTHYWAYDIMPDQNINRPSTQRIDPAFACTWGNSSKAKNCAALVKKHHRDALAKAAVRELQMRAQLKALNAKFPGRGNLDRFVAEHSSPQYYSYQRSPTDKVPQSEINSILENSEGLNFTVRRKN